MKPLKSMMARASARLSRFHDDEDGMEALQVVMIIAIAAVMLILIKSFWGRISTWFSNLLNKILNWTS